MVAKQANQAPQASQGNTVKVALAWLAYVACWAYLAAPLAQASHVAQNQAAQAALGQPNLTQGYGVINQGGGVTDRSLAFPMATVSDGQWTFVADYGNHRVLIWQTTSPTTNQPADIVLGHGVGVGAFTRGMENDGRGAAADTLKGLMGLAVRDDCLVVADTLNSRVLIWKQIHQINGLYSGKPADVVVGQADMTATAPNRGGDAALNTLSFPEGVGLVNGTLWVADTGNGRVLQWTSLPSTNGTAANASMTAEGQAPLVASGTGGGPLEVTLLQKNNGVAGDDVPVILTLALSVGSGTGRLVGLSLTLLGTGGESRTGAVKLYRDTNGNGAWDQFSDQSLWGGAAIFDVANHSLAVLSGAAGVTLSSTPAGYFVVLYPVTAQQSGNNKTIGLSVWASDVRMNPGMASPRGVAVDEVNGRLYVSDDHRVLVWNTLVPTSNVAATWVIGQPSFATNDANRAGAVVPLSNVGQLAVIGGKLWAADAGNQRVLLFEDPPVLPPSQSESQSIPKITLGQPGTAGTSALLFWTPRGVGVAGHRVFVADTENHRVLRFDAKLGVEVAPTLPTHLDAAEERSIATVNIKTSPLLASATWDKLFLSLGGTVTLTEVTAIKLYRESDGQSGWSAADTSLAAVTFGVPDVPSFGWSLTAVTLSAPIPETVNQTTTAYYVVLSSRADMAYETFGGVNVLTNPRLAVLQVLSLASDAEAALSQDPSPMLTLTAHRSHYAYLYGNWDGFTYQTHEVGVASLLYRLNLSKLPVRAGRVVWSTVTFSLLGTVEPAEVTVRLLKDSNLDGSWTAGDETVGSVTPSGARLATFTVNHTLTAGVALTNWFVAVIPQPSAQTKTLSLSYAGATASSGALEWNDGLTPRALTAVLGPGDLSAAGKSLAPTTVQAGKEVVMMAITLRTVQGAGVWRSLAVSCLGTAAADDAVVRLYRDRGAAGWSVSEDSVAAVRSWTPDGRFTLTVGEPVTTAPVVYFLALSAVAPPVFRTAGVTLMEWTADQPIPAGPLLLGVSASSTVTLQVNRAEAALAVPQRYTVINQLNRLAVLSLSAMPTLPLTWLTVGVHVASSGASPDGKVTLGLFRDAGGDGVFTAGTDATLSRQTVGASGDVFLALPSHVIQPTDTGAAPQWILDALVDGALEDAVLTYSLWLVPASRSTLTVSPDVAALPARAAGKVHVSWTAIDTSTVPWQSTPFRLPIFSFSPYADPLETWRKLVVNIFGNTGGSEILRVELTKDVNGNGEWDAGEPTLGTAAVGAATRVTLALAPAVSLTPAGEAYLLWAVPSGGEFTDPIVFSVPSDGWSHADQAWSPAEINPNPFIVSLAMVGGVPQARLYHYPALASPTAFPVVPETRHKIAVMHMTLAANNVPLEQSHFTKLFVSLSGTILPSEIDLLAWGVSASSSVTLLATGTFNADRLATLSFDTIHDTSNARQQSAPNDTVYGLTLMAKAGTEGKTVGVALLGGVFNGTPLKVMGGTFGPGPVLGAGMVYGLTTSTHTAGLALGDGVIGGQEKLVESFLWHVHDGSVVQWLRLTLWPSDAPSGATLRLYRNTAGNTTLDGGDELVAVAPLATPTVFPLNSLMLTGVTASSLPTTAPLYAFLTISFASGSAETSVSLTLARGGAVFSPEGSPQPQEALEVGRVRVFPASTLVDYVETTIGGLPVQPLPLNWKKIATVRLVDAVTQPFTFTQLTLSLAGAVSPSEVTVRVREIRDNVYSGVYFTLQSSGWSAQGLGALTLSMTWAQPGHPTFPISSPTFSGFDVEVNVLESAGNKPMRLIPLGMGLADASAVNFRRSSTSTRTVLPPLRPFTVSAAALPAVNTVAQQGVHLMTLVFAYDASWRDPLNAASATVNPIVKVSLSGTWAPADLAVVQILRVNGSTLDNLVGGAVGSNRTVTLTFPLAVNVTSPGTATKWLVRLTTSASAAGKSGSLQIVEASGLANSGTVQTLALGTPLAGQVVTVRPSAGLQLYTKLQVRRIAYGGDLTPVVLVSLRSTGGTVRWTRLTLWGEGLERVETLKVYKDQTPFGTWGAEDVEIGATQGAATLGAVQMAASSESDVTEAGAGYFVMVQPLASLTAPAAFRLALTHGLQLASDQGASFVDAPLQATLTFRPMMVTLVTGLPGSFTGTWWCTLVADELPYTPVLWSTLELTVYAPLTSLTLTLYQTTQSEGSGAVAGNSVPWAGTVFPGGPATAVGVTLEVNRMVSATLTQPLRWMLRGDAGVSTLAVGGKVIEARGTPPVRLGGTGVNNWKGNASFVYSDPSQTNSITMYVAPIAPTSDVLVRGGARVPLFHLTFVASNHGAELTSVNFSRSNYDGNFNLMDCSVIELWEDVGSQLGAWDAGDVLLKSAEVNNVSDFYVTGFSRALPKEVRMHFLAMGYPSRQANTSVTLNMMVDWFGVSGSQASLVVLPGSTALRSTGPLRFTDAANQVQMAASQAGTGPLGFGSLVPLAGLTFKTDFGVSIVRGMGFTLWGTATPEERQFLYLLRDNGDGVFTPGAEATIATSYQPANAGTLLAAYAVMNGGAPPHEVVSDPVSVWWIAVRPLSTALNKSIGLSLESIVVDRPDVLVAAPFATAERTLGYVGDVGVAMESLAPGPEVARGAANVLWQKMTFTPGERTLVFNGVAVWDGSASLGVTRLVFYKDNGNGVLLPSEDASLAAGAFAGAGRGVTLSGFSHTLAAAFGEPVYYLAADTAPDAGHAVQMTLVWNTGGNESFKLAPLLGTDILRRTGAALTLVTQTSVGSLVQVTVGTSGAVAPAFIEPGGEAAFFRLSPVTTGGTVSLIRLAVASTLATADQEIALVKAYVDRNGTGVWEPGGDSLVGTAVLVGGAATLEVSVPVNAQERAVFVNLSLVPGVPVGRLISARLDGVIVSDGALLASLPVESRLSQVQPATTMLVYHAETEDASHAQGTEEEYSRLFAYAAERTVVWQGLKMLRLGSLPSGQAVARMYRDTGNGVWGAGEDSLVGTGTLTGGAPVLWFSPEQTLSDQPATYFLTVSLGASVAEGATFGLSLGGPEYFLLSGNRVSPDNTVFGVPVHTVTDVPDTLRVVMAQGLLPSSLAKGSTWNNAFRFSLDADRDLALLEEVVVYQRGDSTVPDNTVALSLWRIPDAGSPGSLNSVLVGGGWLAGGRVTLVVDPVRRRVVDGQEPTWWITADLPALGVPGSGAYGKSLGLSLAATSWKVASPDTVSVVVTPPVTITSGPIRDAVPILSMDSNAAGVTANGAVARGATVTLLHFSVKWDVTPLANIGDLVALTLYNAVAIDQTTARENIKLTLWRDRGQVGVFEPAGADEAVAYLNNTDFGNDPGLYAQAWTTLAGGGMRAVLNTGLSVQGGTNDIIGETLSVGTAEWYYLTAAVGAEAPSVLSMALQLSGIGLWDKTADVLTGQYQVVTSPVTYSLSAPQTTTIRLTGFGLNSTWNQQSPQGSDGFKGLMRLTMAYLSGGEVGELRALVLTNAGTALSGVEVRAEAPLQGRSVSATLVNGALSLHFEPALVLPKSAPFAYLTLAARALNRSGNDGQTVQLSLAAAGVVGTAASVTLKQFDGTPFVMVKHTSGVIQEGDALAEVDTAQATWTVYREYVRPGETLAVASVKFNVLGNGSETLAAEKTIWDWTDFLNFTPGSATMTNQEFTWRLYRDTNLNDAWDAGDASIAASAPNDQSIIYQSAPTSYGIGVMYLYPQRETLMGATTPRYFFVAAVAPTAAVGHRLHTTVGGNYGWVWDNDAGAPPVTTTDAISGVKSLTLAVVGQPVLTLAAARSVAPPVTTVVAPTPLLALSFIGDQFQPAVLTGLTLTLGGENFTLADAAQVGLYRDGNANGRLDAGEATLDVAAVTSATVLLTNFSETFAPGVGGQYVVAVTPGRGSRGHRLEIAVPALSFIRVASNTLAAAAGVAFPVKSQSTLLDVTKNILSVVGAPLDPGPFGLTRGGRIPLMELTMTADGPLSLSAVVAANPEPGAPDLDVLFVRLTHHGGAEYTSPFVGGRATLSVNLAIPTTASLAAAPRFTVSYDLSPSAELGRAVGLAVVTCLVASPHEVSMGVLSAASRPVSGRADTVTALLSTAGVIVGPASFGAVLATMELTVSSAGGESLVVNRLQLTLDAPLPVANLRVVEDLNRNGAPDAGERASASLSLGATRLLAWAHGTLFGGIALTGNVGRQLLLVGDVAADAVLNTVATIRWAGVAVTQTAAYGADLASVGAGGTVVSVDYPLRLTLSGADLAPSIGKVGETHLLLALTLKRINGTGVVDAMEIDSLVAESAVSAEASVRLLWFRESGQTAGWQRNEDQSLGAAVFQGGPARFDVPGGWTFAAGGAGLSTVTLYVAGEITPYASSDRRLRIQMVPTGVKGSGVAVDGAGVAGRNMLFVDPPDSFFVKLAPLVQEFAFRGQWLPLLSLSGRVKDTFQTATDGVSVLWKRIDVAFGGLAAGPRHGVRLVRDANADGLYQPWLDTEALALGEVVSGRAWLTLNAAGLPMRGGSAFQGLVLLSLSPEIPVGTAWTAEVASNTALVMGGKTDHVRGDFPVVVGPLTVVDEAGVAGAALHAHGVQGPPGTVMRGAALTLVGGLSLSLTQGAAVVYALRLHRVGTAQDGDLPSLTVYKEAGNQAGFQAGEDPAVGTSTFLEGRMVIPLQPPVLVLSTRPVSLHFGGAVPEGARSGVTFGWALGAPDIQASRLVAVEGAQLPYRSPLMTIGGAGRTLAVAVGDPAAPPSGLQNTSAVVATFAASSSGAVLWTGVSLAAVGTAPAHAVDRWKVIYDVNANGIAEASEPVWGAGREFIPLKGRVDGAVSALLVADVALTALPGSILQVSVSGISVAPPDAASSPAFVTVPLTLQDAQDTVTMIGGPTGVKGAEQDEWTPLVAMTVRAWQDQAAWQSMTVSLEGSLAVSHVVSVDLRSLNGATLGTAAPSGTTVTLLLGSLEPITTGPRLLVVGVVLGAAATPSLTVGVSVVGAEVAAPDLVAALTLRAAPVPVLDAERPAAPEVTLEGKFSKSLTALRMGWKSRIRKGTIAASRYLVVQAKTGPSDVEALKTSLGLGADPEASAWSVTVPWTVFGTDAQVVHSGVVLGQGLTYYVAFQAQSQTGKWSDVGVSEPIVIDGIRPRLPNKPPVAVIGKKQLLISWDLPEAGPSGVSIYILERRKASKPTWEEVQRFQAPPLRSSADVGIRDGGFVGLAPVLTPHSALRAPHAIESKLAPFLTETSVVIPKDDGTSYYRVKAVSGAGEESEPTQAAKVVANVESLPGVINDLHNYPNPFKSETEPTTIVYTLNQDTEVSIMIFDVLGELVRSMTMAAGLSGGQAGTNEVTWDGATASGRKAASGVYLCVVKSAATGPLNRVVRKIAIIR